MIYKSTSDELIHITTRPYEPIRGQSHCIPNSKPLLYRTPNLQIRRLVTITSTKKVTEHGKVYLIPIMPLLP